MAKTLADAKAAALAAGVDAADVNLPEVLARFGFEVQSVAQRLDPAPAIGTPDEYRAEVAAAVKEMEANNVPAAAIDSVLKIGSALLTFL